MKPLALESLDHGQAVHLGHVEVEHEDVGLLALNGRQDVLTTEAEGLDREALPAEKPLEAVKDERMVVGQHQPCGQCRRCLG